MSNQPPDQMKAATFVLREVAALLFVGGWLLLFAGELLTGRYHLPFWVHCVGVGVLAYALGVSVAELTAYRKPSLKKARAQEEG